MTTEADLPSDAELGPHAGEPHHSGTSGLLNWLRAAVLGANDGIVSTAGLVVGVAGATSDRAALLTAGLGGPAGGLHVSRGRGVRVRADPARLRDGGAGRGEKGVEGTAGGGAGGVDGTSGGTGAVARRG